MIGYALVTSPIWWKMSRLVSQPRISRSRFEDLGGISGGAKEEVSEKVGGMGNIVIVEVADGMNRGVNDNIAG